mgnify:CR=1 FL=1|jgi:hypothetical protein
MQGVIQDLLIGFILFTPIGFLAGYLQHKKDNEKQKKEQSNSEILSQNQNNIK